ncbi:MAG: hypothetical protein COA80_19740 [Leeuwenhoekiella sp.]|nr:MAG: hypothetical protein COA80_19740 [Leeuwenhoekiella sp.]
MYRSVLVFFVVLLFYSCKEQLNFDRGASKAANDSITHYYKNAQDNNLPLDDRLRFTNQALQSLENQKSDSLYLKLMYQKSWLQFSMGQYDSLIKSDRLLHDTANPTEAAAILGMQNYLMGYYFEQVVQKPDSAFQRFNRSRFYYKQANDSSWIGKNLLNMANIQQTQSDFFGSKETLTEAIQYIEAGEDPNTIASVYNSLGTNHRKLFNYTDALDYYLEAIKTSDDQAAISNYKNNLATVYIDLKTFDKARSILEAIAVDSLDRADTRARVMDNLAYANWLSGRPVSANAFLEPLRLRKQEQDKRGLLASYTHLGEYYSKTQSQRAVNYLDSVIDLSKELKAPRAEYDALGFLMKLKPGNMGIRDRYIHLQDSLYKRELKVKTQFAKYKYDDRLKEESILRLEKENAQAELEATRERNYRYWLLAGVMGLVALIVMGFYIYQQRIKRLKAQNRADRLEASYATEAALSQRLHDDFGAGLHHVMLLVQSNADAGKVLDELDKLYQQSRNFSREINAVDTGVNFKEALYAMLDQHKPEETRLLISGSKEVAWQSLSNVTKITLYKILRELFINMSKHSRAGLVTLNLKQHPDKLEIRYSDNGVGVDAALGFEKNGLLITEKRMEAIGGTITFESDRGKGFKAVISIPN